MERGKKKHRKQPSQDELTHRQKHKTTTHVQSHHELITTAATWRTDHWSQCSQCTPASLRGFRQPPAALLTVKPCLACQRSVKLLKVSDKTSSALKAPNDSTQVSAGMQAAKRTDFCSCASRGAGVRPRGGACALRQKVLMCKCRCWFVTVRAGRVHACPENPYAQFTWAIGKSNCGKGSSLLLVERVAHVYIPLNTRLHNVCQRVADYGACANAGFPRMEETEHPADFADEYELPASTDISDHACVPWV